MNTKVVTCRTHGGTFTVPVKRGRPPVNCTPENKCRKLEPVEVAMARARHEDSRAYHRELATAVKPAESTPEPLYTTGKASRGVAKGKAAKAQLEAIGWQAEGKGSNGKITLTATRGVELLVITWDMNGELISQDYSLWDTTVGTGRNGRPDHKLPFDPEETPDADLVRELSGMKVTWWNSLAQAETTDVVQAGTIKIEHSYETNGDEVYGDRTVKFIGYGGGGFRAFRLAALIKVG